LKLYDEVCEYLGGYFWLPRSSKSCKNFTIRRPEWGDYRMNRKALRRHLRDILEKRPTPSDLLKKDDDC
jgi:hypothetical protein